MERVADGHVTSPAGFRAAGVTAGIKVSGRPDLALLVSDTPASAAGVFTTNRVHAYNVARNRALLAEGGGLRAVVVNSGNANVATGAQGRADTEEMAALVAAGLGAAAASVAVAQTGVIGVPLPMAVVRAAIPLALAGLSADGGPAAAEAICTTDTCVKQGAVRLDLGGVAVTMGAMAKGAGMIHPNMATLLCFVTTDAAIAPAPWQQALRTAVDRTLNAVTIDGDQSTSDTCLALANGQAGNEPITSLADRRLTVVTDALTALLDPLAALVARDGEGATKLIRVEARGAASAADARLAARAVAASNLVKCALRGNDPNWGRIACAVGYSGAAVDQGRLSVTVNGARLMVAGEPVPFDGAAVSAALDVPEVTIVVDLGVGEATGHAYGCDLTEEYVRFNSEYTT